MLLHNLFWETYENHKEAVGNPEASQMDLSNQCLALGGRFENAHERTCRN
jgi:hypothetical protein